MTAFRRLKTLHTQSPAGVLKKDARGAFGVSEGDG